MLTEEALTSALAVQRKMYACLSEISELTGELSQAVNRQDQVSVRLFLSMRQEEVDRLLGYRATLNRQCAQLPPADNALLRQVLAGTFDGTLPTSSGQAVVQQAKTNRNLLQRICQADQMVSQRFGGKDSFYSK